MNPLRCLALAPMLALFAGCTHGEVVNENYTHAALDVALSLVAVDANGHPTGPAYSFPAPSSDSAKGWVSFDPYAPTSSNVNGTGYANVKANLPTGDYYAGISVPAAGTPNGVAYATSPVFHHDYYQTCTDFFTGQQNEPCADYVFQLISSCTDWKCVNTPGGAGDGSRSSTPATLTHNGNRVIQMLVSVSGAPNGVLQNGW